MHGVHGFCTRNRAPHLINYKLLADRCPWRGAGGAGRAFFRLVLNGD